MKSNVTRILAAIVIVLSLGLVIGRHFDAVWAGGEGYRARVMVMTDVVDGDNCALTVVDATRINLQTCADQHKKLSFGPSTIWMDKKASFVVTDNREGKEALASHGGRSIIRGPLSIGLRDIAISTTGAVSLVDYSWLQKAEIYAIDGDVTLVRGDEVLTVPSGKALSFDTVAPYDAAEDIVYSFDTGAAEDFYTWARENGAY